ncbi:hypothetical protein T12_4835, partial [Trichinella patagoniensis]
LPDERTSGKIVPEHLERTEPLRKLAANKVRLNCLLTELEELSIDAVDDNLLGGQLELTEALFRETDALQGEWEQDLEAGERKATIEDWAKSRRRFLEARARAQGRLRPKQLNGPSCSEGCNSGNLRQTAAPARIGKLPELTLPQFDGEVLKFPTFWAQFEASVHADTELDDATKFAYLLSNTTGRALGAIAGIPITAANYPQAVGILQKRFGRPKIVARAHLLALWKAPECREMTRQGIQTLVDEITKQLRCLAAMGKDPHAGELPWSEALMPGLKEKFPRKLQRAWDLKVGSGPESEDNLEKFLEFAQLQADSLSPPDEFSPEASREEKGGEATRKELKNARKKGRDRVTSSAAALVTSVQRVCPFCEGDHDVTGCQRFLDAGYSARMSMSREKGVCYKCLKTGHRARECRTSRPCGVDGCRQPHHQLLHPPSTGKPSRPPGPDQAHQSLLAARSEPGGCLQTVRARAYGPDGNHVVVNCLFDTGAEVSFIRKDVAEVLGLTGSHERCRFTTLGGRVGPERKWRRVEFRLGAVGGSGQAETSTPVQALAIPQVCGQIQPLPTRPAGSIPAEPEMGQRPGTPLLIDVLIGIDYYYEFVTGRIRRTTSGTVAVETRLGWLVCGKTDPRQSPKAQVLLTKGEGSDDDILRRFWEIESLGITTTEDTAADGTAAMKKFEEDLHLDGGSNYSHARRRLLVLERRLRAREEDRLQYASVMKQYFDEGWAEPAPEASPPGRTWYLPHHAVYQGAGSERKCRVVFDGAAPYKGITLNRQLEVGPNLQIDLLRAILSFRRLRVGLQADIEKMYLQIRVRAEDRDACRFLWRDDEQKIRKYRLTRNYESKPRAAEEVLNHMYMDDLATSCDSVAEARTLVDQLSSLLASGGFRLHKPPMERTTIGAGGRPWKTLGIYWERDEDYLTFVNPVRSRPEGGDTKRQLLSVASGIFDPIGCLAPFLVRAKILFQLLWERGLDWDEPLLADVERPWLAWKSELEDLSLIRLPRALVPIPLDHVKRIELHAFSDASERAYGAVVYLRVEPSSGPAWVRLTAAKTRVAPVKRLSLPRLELMGALVAARLIRYVQGALNLDIHSLSCWSDKIQQLVEPTRWRHCPGKSNPADVLSRGASLRGLSKNCCWWQGPRWLAEPSEAWPRKLGPSESKPPSPPDEGRSPQAALLVSVVTHSPDHGLDPRRYGDIEKLFRITALCLRFVHNCGSVAKDRRSGPLTATELEASEQVWVRIAQRQAFPKEIEALKRNGKVPAHSDLDQLTPYLDAAGTLRVGGRLEKSNLPFSAKHPALLPSDHEVTRGLVRRCHLRQLHAGVSQTLFALRQRYWIPRGRSRVRQVLRGCLQCRWATGRPPRPRMADLPEARTTPAPAFAHVGMGFAGPLASPRDVDSRCTTGPLTLHGSTRPASGHPDGQLPLLPERCGLTAPTMAGD